MTFLLLLFAAVAAGCAPTNLDTLAAALAKDPASVCIQVTSIYGTARLARTGIHNGNVTCTNDGMAVTSRPAGPAGVLQ